MNNVVKVSRCPICGKVTEIGKYRPFCSKRCADIDLGNWFNENYRVEDEKVDADVSVTKSTEFSSSGEKNCDD